jgi:GWxTD domain-containing protein
MNMVKRCIILLFLLVTAQTVTARSLRIVVDAKQFYAPEQGQYIEIYMQFLANSLHFTGDSINGIKTAISTQIIISKNDEVITFDKYKIEAQVERNGFLDDVYSLKRFILQPGEYNIEYEFVDMNNPKDTIQFVQDIEVYDWRKAPFFSDIQLIESLRKSAEDKAFVKSGYEMIPRLIPYYNVESERLIAYLELYNSNMYKDLPKFAIRYYLRDNFNGRRMDDFTVTKVYNSVPVLPLIVNLNIAELRSGSYTFVIEFLDNEEIVLKKRELQLDRFNPGVEDVVIDFSQTIVDPRFFEELPDDSLFYYLESLTPISSQADISQIYKLIASKDREMAKKYFQSYWIRTDSRQPTDAWIKYKRLVVQVEQEFGSMLFPGFRTDRGRILLKYGPPNAKIQRPNEPEEYPYEIWQYYKIENFSNRRFVFYNPSMIGNEYVLLHSDMPGELFNNRWNLDLSRTGGTVRTRVNDEGVLDGGRRR